ncbi:MAG: hypothetical protein LBC45_02830 [Chlamydiales bacterium]|jgi:hypothetical protein|nr:hypothetical protein [Chlamydiales bacterium]
MSTIMPNTANHTPLHRLHEIIQELQKLTNQPLGLHYTSTLLPESEKASELKNSCPKKYQAKMTGQEGMVCRYTKMFQKYIDQKQQNLSPIQ